MSWKNSATNLTASFPRCPTRSAFRSNLETLVSVYPFNEYEYIIAALLAASKLTHDEYVELRDAYIARNMFLYIFEISAPRGFGEAWAQGHLKELVPELQKPSKKLDSSYSGEYDFLLDDRIKIEVKASRAVDFDSDEPLYVKALASDSTKRFDMNFQQVKPACCDVFVWIGVWRDVHPILGAGVKEMASNRYSRRDNTAGTSARDSFTSKTTTFASSPPTKHNPISLPRRFMAHQERQRKP